MSPTLGILPVFCHLFALKRWGDSANSLCNPFQNWAVKSLINFARQKGSKLLSPIPTFCLEGRPIKSWLGQRISTLSPSTRLAMGLRLRISLMFANSKFISPGVNAGGIS